MRVQVLREACCAQDDQLGPLEASYSVAPSATLEELVGMVVGSGFLQYSSSHVSMLGEVGATRIVRVFSPYHCNNSTAEFLVPRTQTVASVVGDGVLSFRFVAP